MTELNKEQNIVDSVVKKFDFMNDKIKTKRIRRISAEVVFNNFRQVFDYMVKELNFNAMCMITGLDEGENFGLIYHITGSHGVVLNLKTDIPRNNPVLKTISDIFPGAILYERELVDMFGIKVEGLPEGNRYPLFDDWPKDQYPLRKDWTPDMLDKKGGN